MEDEAHDLAKLDGIVKEVGAESGSLIPILQRTQNAYGYLPREVLNAISQRLSVPPKTKFWAWLPSTPSSG